MVLTTNLFDQGRELEIEQSSLRALFIQPTAQTNRPQSPLSKLISTLSRPGPSILTIFNLIIAITDLFGLVSEHDRASILNGFKSFSYVTNWCQTVWKVQHKEFVGSYIMLIDNVTCFLQCLHCSWRSMIADSLNCSWCSNLLITVVDITYYCKWYSSWIMTDNILGFYAVGFVAGF